MSFARIQDHQLPHLITFSTLAWLDVLTQPIYKKIIVERLKQDQQQGLQLFAFLVMTNQVHLVACADEHSNLIYLLSKFKQDTEQKLCEAMEENGEDLRTSWIKKILEEESHKEAVQFWQKKVEVTPIQSAPMAEHQLNYLHERPVKAGIVREPHHYVYSSASNYVTGTGLLNLGK